MESAAILIGAYAPARRDQREITGCALSAASECKNKIKLKQRHFAYVCAWGPLFIG